MQKNAWAAVCTTSDFCSILIGIVQVLLKGVDPASCSSSVCSQWVVGENGVLKPKRVNPNVYQPPSLKGRCGRHNSRRRSCVVTYPCVRAPFFFFCCLPCFAAVNCLHYISIFTNTCMWQMGGRAQKKKIHCFFLCACVRCTGRVSARFCSGLHGGCLCLCVAERKVEISAWQLWDSGCESRKSGSSRIKVRGAYSCGARTPTHTHAHKHEKQDRPSQTCTLLSHVLFKGPILHQF